jgi:carboxyl-terminal processing protease
LPAALVAVGGLAGPCGPLPVSGQAAPPEADLQQNLAAFARVYALVEQNFAEPVSPDRAIYQGAIQGMLRTLDPHSNFLDPKTFQLLQQDQRGQYYGVGMEISMDGADVIVTQPFPGSPAQKAGLRRGDVIASVNGKDTAGLDSAQVADLLKGPRGTQVEVRVRRVGGGEPLSFTITRGEISRSDVDGFWLKPGIAYVRIASFSNQNTGRETAQKLKELDESNIQGLLLDLRNNPGGLVSEAVAVAGRFLEPGQTVVSHRGRASAEQVFKAEGESAARKYPIIVLVDRYSASAAEIVAGALQDHDRALVMGENTFGKGLVQAQFPLSEGALLLTIARYYTPSGRLIQRDYLHTSFLDYYYHRTESLDLKDAKHTDAGRAVYGGGGIAPDEKYPAEKYTAFQRRLGSRLVFYHFANQYFGLARPALPEGWKPDADVMKRFQVFLTAGGTAFSDSEFEQNRAWVEEQLRFEMYTRAFDRQRADRFLVEEDPEVRQAAASLPAAQALAQHFPVANARTAPRR